jgi:hypothetical protein
MAADLDAIALFDGDYKKDRTVRPFDEASQERLGGRLPEPLLALLRRDGFASYEKQLLWTCDPDEWNGPAKPWFPSAGAEVFMRTAFGHLFLWDGQYCWFASPPGGQVTFAVDGMDWFLARWITPKDVLAEAGITRDTKRARKEAGELEPDEIFLWVPALALGGSQFDSAIDKGKASVGLNLLAGLQPISIQQV